MIGMKTVHFRAKNGVRALSKWIVPYVRSRIHANEFRPILSYLFTEWKCNMGCDYCYTYDNSVPGMTFDTAKRSMDWLKTTGCRVVAIMGGEPLLRKDFIVDVIDYGVRNGLFLYLPTNGVLMDEAFIDRVGRAGVAAMNLAVDCIEPKPGLPKGLSRIEGQFRYLVEKMEDYGYMIFLNINITSKNMADVRKLTEIAMQYRIGVDYHINERPHVEQAHYRPETMDTYIEPDQYEEADALLDWLIDRNLKGQPMINSAAHLAAMKPFLRGELETWPCRAGRNSSAIRVDGSLSPCFGLYSSDTDWGHIGAPKFDPERIEAVKKQCLRHCLSTCQFTMGHYYEGLGFWYWAKKFSITGGMTGSNGGRGAAGRNR